MVSTRNHSERAKRTIELADRTAKPEHEVPKSSTSPRKKRRFEKSDEAAGARSNIATKNNAPHKQDDGLKHSIISEDEDVQKPTLQSTEALIPTAIPKAKATHIKFDSELQLPSAESSAPLKDTRAPTKTELQNHARQESDDDSDEAPEAISAAAGEESARIALTEATKAAKSQRHAAKEARRKRDSRLKLQAAAKPASKRRRDELSSDEDDQRTSTQLAEELLASGVIPEFLPDEILNAEPASLPATTSASQNIRTISAKLKLATDLTRPYKDVKAGTRTIRVLKKPNQLLPPMISKSSKITREAWLRGTRGGKPEAAVNRRLMKSRFTRN